MPVKIAYFSPLSPQRSGISDYSEELLPHLARYADIHIFIDDFTPSNRGLAERFPVRNYRAFAPEGYDVVLYQMGNSPYHGYLYPILLDRPGITVLHDLVLHHLIAGQTLGRGDPAAYAREMVYAYGRHGLAVARQVQAGHRPPPFFDYPLVERVLDASLGVIVHSEYVRREVERLRPEARVRRVPMGIEMAPPMAPREELRFRQGIDSDRLVVISLGEVTPHKRIETVMRAFARLRRVIPEALYVVVGQVAPELDLTGLAASLKIEESVVMAGAVERARFLDYLHTADICVNLRYPTAGETSATMLRAMAASKPVVVSDVGAVAEVPDDCVIKLAVDQTEEELLYRLLLLLAQDAGLRRTLGEQARRYVEQHHSLAAAAQAYCAFWEEVLLADPAGGGRMLGRPVPLLEHLAREMVTLGVEQDRALTEGLARAVVELGWGPNTGKDLSP